jgi:hypothetical protein
LAHPVFITALSVSFGANSVQQTLKEDVSVQYTLRNKIVEKNTRTLVRNPRKCFFFPPHFS